MKKRIKENELKNIIKVFKNKNLEIEKHGLMDEFVFIEKVCVYIDEIKSSFNIKSGFYKMAINLAFVEEIYYLENEKLIFKLENDIEIDIKINRPKINKNKS